MVKSGEVKKQIIVVGNEDFLRGRETTWGKAHVKLQAAAAKDPVQALKKIGRRGENREGKSRDSGKPRRQPLHLGLYCDVTIWDLLTAQLISTE